MSQAQFPLRTLSSDDMLKTPERPNPFMKNKGKAPQRQLFDQSPTEPRINKPEPEESQYKLRKPASSPPQQPMGHSAPSPADPAGTAQQPTLADVKASAIDALAGGNKPKKVEDAIVHRCGLSRQDAHMIVQQALTDTQGVVMTASYATAKRRSCIKHLVLGSLWFLGGVGVTIGTLFFSEGGGYVLAYGAIIVGGLQAAYGFCGTIYYTLKK